MLSGKVSIDVKRIDAYSILAEEFTRWMSVTPEALLGRGSVAISKNTQRLANAISYNEVADEHKGLLYRERQGSGALTGNQVVMVTGSTTAQ